MLFYVFLSCDGLIQILHMLPPSGLIDSICKLSDYVPHLSCLCGFSPCHPMATQFYHFMKKIVSALQAGLGDYVHHRTVHHCNGTVPAHPFTGKMVLETNLSRQRNRFCHKQTKKKRTLKCQIYSSGIPGALSFPPIFSFDRTAPPDNRPLASAFLSEWHP